MGGSFGVLWAVVGVAAVAVVVSMARHRRHQEAARAGGVTAQARCVRVKVVRQPEGFEVMGTTRYQTYEFTAPDGRLVRFEEIGRPETAEGDVVTVYYDPARPERATVFGPRR
jgi:hypothetical protein